MNQSQASATHETIQKLARNWEDNLTDEEYVQHFGYIRKRISPNECKQKLNTVKHIARKLVDRDREVNDENNVKMSSKFSIPVPPNTIKPSSTRKTPPEWVDPMRVDFSSPQIKKSHTYKTSPRMKSVLNTSTHTPIKQELKEDGSDIDSSQPVTAPVPTSDNHQQQNHHNHNHNHNHNRTAKKRVTGERKEHVSSSRRHNVIMIGEIPSKPLQWGQRFGNAGRKQKQMKKVTRIKLSLIPPPPKAEDLIDIIHDITNDVVNKLIIQLQQLSHFVKTIPNTNSNYSHINMNQEYKQDCREINESLQYLQDQEQSKITTTTVTTGEDVISFDFSDISEVKDKRFYLHQARAKWLQKHREKSVNFSKDNNNNNNDDDNGDENVLALKVLLSITMSIPNIRPANEVLESILWILKQSEDSNNPENFEDSSIFDLFKCVSKPFLDSLIETKQHLTIIADNKADRSTIANSKENQCKHSEAALALRTWFDKTSLDVSCVNESKDITDINDTAYDNVTTSSKGNLLDRVVTAKSSINNDFSILASSRQYSQAFSLDTKKSQGIETSVAASVYPIKPIAAGIVAPIGHSKDKISEPPNSLIAMRRIRTKVPLQSLDIFFHREMKRFLDALTWAKKIPLTNMKIEKLRQKNLESNHGIQSPTHSQPQSQLQPLIDDTYDEFFNNFDVVDMSEKEWKGDDQSIHNSNSNSSDNNNNHHSMSKYLRDQSEESHFVSRSKIEQSLNLREHHGLMGPNMVISLNQKRILLISILADICQTIILNVLTLAKHAWAGKQMEYPEISTVFGLSINIIDTKYIFQLQRWLDSNRRSDMTFKLATETQMDLALQKASSYWPRLALKVLRGHRNSEQEIRCVTRLVWQDKKRTHELFRNPNSFEPNINYI